MLRFFIPLALGLLPIAAIAQQKACVQGVVLDDKGAPVPKVRVSLQPLPPKPLLKGLGTTHSDAQGEFHITDMEAGDYWIITSKPSDGYPDTLAAIYGDGRAPKTSLTASTICNVVTVNLGPKAARLEIDALNADDHTRVPNPRFKLVKLSTGAWTSGSADQDILIPAETKVSVEITADGYKPSSVIVLEGLRPDEKRHLTVDLHPTRGNSTGQQRSADYQAGFPSAEPSSHTALRCQKTTLLKLISKFSRLRHSLSLQKSPCRPANA